MRRTSFVYLIVVLLGCQGGVGKNLHPDGSDTNEELDWSFRSLTDGRDGDVEPRDGWDAGREDAPPVRDQPFMAPCADDSECASGICLEHLGEGVCGGGCGDCPQGWTCKEIIGGGGETLGICVSIHANLCKPCVEDDDCTSPGGQDDLCVDYGAEGRFCGGYCQADGDCPEEYLCQEIPSRDDSASKQCIPYGDECLCTDKSIALGLDTVCTLSNEHGVCPGTRACTDDGLSDCEGTSASPDVCNGLDDDCDGDTDDLLCNDENPCTDDACDGQEDCLHTPNTLACDDGDPCTTDDVCDQGTCQGGEALACDDQVACTADSCETDVGCVYTPDDDACDDQVPCTGDACDPLSGCTNTPEDAACDDEIPCTADDCDPVAGCTNEPDDAACDDGVPCTTDSCLPDQGCLYQGQPTDCVVDDWGPWSSCDADCGGGLQTRTRAVLVEQGCGGAPCPPLEESEPCNTFPCPLDCIVSEWSEWSECVGDCSAGAHSRIRTVTQFPQAGGAPCPPLEETEPCSTDGQACADGTACTMGDICVAGICVGVAEDAVCDDGIPCTTDICVPGQGCLHQDQPVDCVVDDWGPWGPCDADCGGGLRTRTRSVLVEPSCGGAPCPSIEETESCNTQDCVPVDCEVGPWSPWNQCTGSCTTGIRTRTREVVQPPVDGGADCPPLEEEEPCDMEGQPCDDGDPCTPETTCQGETCTGAVAMVCGDGLVCGTEECDDGNSIPGDGCEPPCMVVEFIVNGWTALHQTQPAAATLIGGGFAAAWTSQGQDGMGTGVFARIFGPLGAPLGDEVQVNTGWEDDQEEAAVAALPGGGFVVVWQSAHLVGKGRDVFGRRYDTGGQAMGPEFLVNDGTLLDQDHPDVASAGDGFMVVWEEHHPDGESLGIFARRFSGVDAEPGPEIPVNLPVDGFGGKRPAIASLADGSVVVVWHQSAGDGNAFGVVARHLDPFGQPAGASFQVNTHVDGPQQDAVVTALADGGYVVLWSSLFQDGNSWGIYGQRYDAAAVPLGGEFQINVTWADAQSRPAVAPLTDGGFITSWQSMGQDDEDWAVVLRRFAADGGADPEVMAAVVTQKSQTTPVVVPRFVGGWAALWASEGQDGSGYGIFAQLFEGDGSKYSPTL